MVADDIEADPKVDTLITLQGCVFEHWLSPSIPIGSGESGEDGDWEIALTRGWSLGLVNGEGDKGNGNQMEDAVQRLLPEAEQLFHQHFDAIVTLGEALRKKGRGGRLSYEECRAIWDEVEGRPTLDNRAAAAGVEA